MLILQHLYNLSDEQAEYQVRDRLSFMRFLGLQPEDTIPDSNTLWVFREDLARLNLMDQLFIDFDYQLDNQGFKAKKGQIVDASFVDVPRQRNTRAENEDIKAGKIPKRFEENPSVARQKDTDARWTKKNDEVHFGYKSHVSIDNEHKLIRSYEVSSAEVHDSQVFIKVLHDNDGDEVWADSAYRSEEHEAILSAMGHKSQVHQKGSRGHPLSEKAKKCNKKKSKIRARVEHVFGSITNEQGGLYFKVIGLDRNKLKIGMMNVVYNMRRLVTLSRISAPIF